MSIVTKTGDQGITALMFNRRVTKCDPHVEACGAADELNAALGLARAAAQDDAVRAKLLAVQKDLVALMGELATALEDLPRYVKSGYPVVTQAMTAALENWVEQIEARKAVPHGWATPGMTLASATLDVARTVCRRAERRVCALQEAGQLQNAQIIIYLNRLSDLLWLLAREVEARSP
jgi:cob(I)alamin adenosyltransferase